MPGVRYGCYYHADAMHRVHYGCYYYADAMHRVSCYDFPDAMHRVPTMDIYNYHAGQIIFFNVKTQAIGLRW